MLFQTDMGGVVVMAYGWGHGHGRGRGWGHGHGRGQGQGSGQRQDNYASSDVDVECPGHSVLVGYNARSVKLKTDARKGKERKSPTRLIKNSKRSHAAPVTKNRYSLAKYERS